MSLSPNEKYPGATEADPNYKDSKFKDNNPSTTNNGSPLKALDRNEQLALQEAVMNAAGFDYNGVVDTPQNSQMFNAYKAALSNGANLLSNHNFIIASPDDSQPAPSATPTSYPPGFQIFSGVFANETTGILNLTYIDGRVSFSGGDFYMAVPNTGALENITEFVASVADFDGKPRTRGVSYALVGDEYRVTVGIDALEDAGAVLTPLGSVKFEQGSVATGHEVQTTKGDYYSFDNVAEAVANCPSVGSRVSVDDYYGGVSPSGSGVLFFKVVPSGTVDIDGGKGVGVNASKMLEQIMPTRINAKNFGSKGDNLIDEGLVINSALSYIKLSPFGLLKKLTINAGVYNIQTSLDIISDMVIECSKNTWFNCNVPFFNKQDGVDSLNRIRITGNPLIRPDPDGSYTDILFRTDSLSYSEIEARFDGRNQTTNSLFQFINGFGTTNAYNDIKCEFRNCLNSVNGAVFISQDGSPTFFDFTGSLFNSNGKNFTVYGKNHIFGNGTAIEKSLNTGSDVYSPLTTFNQMWIEQDEITIKADAYGCSIEDCRTRGGSLDGTDFHLINWIKDESIAENFFKKHSPGLSYKEGDRRLKAIFPTGIKGNQLVKNGNPIVSYGYHKPMSIVGYAVYITSGGAPTNFSVNVGFNSGNDQQNPSFSPLTSFNLSSGETSTNDKYVITWTNEPSVYFDVNPSSSPFVELLLQFGNSEAVNYNARIAVLAVV